MAHHGPWSQHNAVAGVPGEDVVRQSDNAARIGDIEGSGSSSIAIAAEEGGGDGCPTVVDVHSIFGLEGVLTVENLTALQMYFPGKYVLHGDVAVDASAISISSIAQCGMAQVACAPIEDQVGPPVVH